jgi:hypothetical protein
MARNSGESKQGLIIALVFFVITTLAFGVFAYLGYAEQADLRKAAETAKKDKEEMITKRDQQEARYMALAQSIGNSGADAAANLGVLRAKGAVNQVYQEEIVRGGPINALKPFGFVYDAQQDKPSASVLDMLNTYRTNTEAAQKKAAELEKSLEDTRKTFNEEMAAQKARADKALADLKSLQKQFTDWQANESRVKFVDLTKTIADVSADRDKFNKEKADLEAIKGKEVKQLNEKIKNLNDVITKLQAQLKPVDLLDFDQPKAKLLSVDMRNGTAIIDVGASDYVRPQLTFSVLPAGAAGRGAANRERKGAVEVVEVLGAKQSKVKIIEVTSATRDPLLPGDLLFNPSWNPGQVEHVALAGLIDLDGDGLDDTAQFIRTLERQGIVVDAYIDLKDLTVKGRGLTEKTAYLVEGANPALEGRQGGLSRRDDYAIKVGEKMSELKSQAKDLGVQVVPIRRYLSLIGFKTPRGLNPADYNASGYLRGAGRDAPAAGAKPPEKKSDALPVKE